MQEKRDQAPHTLTHIGPWHCVVGSWGRAQCTKLSWGVLSKEHLHKEVLEGRAQAAWMEEQRGKASTRQAVTVSF